MNDGDPLIRGRGDGVRVTKCLVGHFEDFCFYSEKRSAWKVLSKGVI